MLIIPENYEAALGIRETEVAIKKVKDFFQQALAGQSEPCQSDSTFVSGAGVWFE